MTTPSEMFAVRRELLRRVMKKLDELGEKISVSERTILRGGSA
jgi:hypothetical protein